MVSISREAVPAQRPQGVVEHWMFWGCMKMCFDGVE
jgi:hypothetical protein